MVKDKKRKKLEETKRLLEGKNVLYFVDYTGISANDINKVRRELRNNRVLIRVVNNRITQLVLNTLDIKLPFEEVLKGPTALIIPFDEKDSLSPARHIKQFLDKNINLRVKGAYLENRFCTKEEVERFSKIPSKEELLGEFIRVLKTPIITFVMLSENKLIELIKIIETIKERR